MKTKRKKYTSVDLFSGCGGLTLGMHDAGFKTVAAIEINKDAVKAFKLNHKKTKVFTDDIRNVDPSEINFLLGKDRLHLLAGCPPCQGFSSIRRLNRKQNIRDDRNSLILEYLRMVKSLKPFTVMMENVPGLINYYLFKQLVSELGKLGYNPKVEVVNVKDYGIPQNRKRLVLVGSLLGNLEIAKATNEKVTVKQAIGGLDSINITTDEIHRIVATHTPKVMERIMLTPKDGGSWKDLPKKYILKCHKKMNVGFDDVYGRLRWNDYSTTITGGCMNPSKGRFLHPQEDRALTAREAALLQSFPIDYRFPIDINKTSLALLIGNALPPKFSFIQSNNIKKHLDEYLL